MFKYKHLVNKLYFHNVYKFVENKKIIKNNFRKYFFKASNQNKTLILKTRPQALRIKYWRS